MARTREGNGTPATESFFVKIEPIDSEVPAFSAKATKIAEPEPVEPPIIIVIPPVDPDPTPPGPDWTPVWLWIPDTSKWEFCYQRISGAGPKVAGAQAAAAPKTADECVPPAPPGWSFEWGYSIEMEGWIQGYKRLDGAGPKSAKRK